MAITKVNHPDLLDLASDTGATVFPKGTTAQRPVSPEAGYIRFNTTDNAMETYDGTEWKALDTIVPPEPYSVNYLLIAGGGGGGGALGGNATVYASGGGGGGYKNITNITFSPKIQYNIQVGAGGSGGVGQGLSPSTDGLNSQISGSNITTTIAYGGIGGGKTNLGPGGSSGFLPSNAGGNASGDVYWGGGGGGGIGSNGLNGAGGKAGNGGNGLQFSITGLSIYYGGGGGGIYQQTFLFGSGGLGGGGNGKGFPANGDNGSTNLGGGGGAAGSSGGSSATLTGGSGGSGVVILRMPTANYTGATTGSPTVTTDGSDTILTYTSSGTYTA